MHCSATHPRRRRVAVVPASFEVPASGESIRHRYQNHLEEWRTTFEAGRQERKGSLGRAEGVVPFGKYYVDPMLLLALQIVEDY